MANNWN